MGDPFIAPYLAGVYQRLGLEYSSLLCFPRLTLLWRSLAAAAAAEAAEAAEEEHGGGGVGAAGGGADGGGGKEEEAGDGGAAEEEAGAAEASGMAVSGAGGAGEASGGVLGPSGQPGHKVGAAAAAAPAAARIVPLEWHMQQLHRELVLEVRCTWDGRWCRRGMRDGQAEGGRVDGGSLVSRHNPFF